MRVPLEKPVEVMTVSSNTEEDLVALEKIAEKVVKDIVEDTAAPQKMVSPLTPTGTVILETDEDSLAEEIQSQVFNAADVLCGQVIPLLRYLDNEHGKYAGTTNNGSYVELVRNRTQAKVAATSATTAQEQNLDEVDAKYEVLRKRLAEEVELGRFLEKTCESFREDIEFARCATVDLQSRLEASRTAFNAESRRVDELTAASEKKK